MNAADALLRAILEDPTDDFARLVYADRLEETGQAERAEFIRVQVELAKYEVPSKTGRRWDCPSEVDFPALRRRERELLEARWRQWAAEAFWEIHISGPVPVEATPTEGFVYGIFRRGFVAAVTCTCADWEAHGRAIVLAQPVEAVALTDLEIEWVSREPGWPGWFDDGRVYKWDPDPLFPTYYLTESTCHAAIEGIALAWARHEAGLPALAAGVALG